MIKTWQVLDANQEIIDRFEGPEKQDEAIASFLHAHPQVVLRLAAYLKEVESGQVTRIEDCPLDCFRYDVWRVFDMFPDQALTVRSRLADGMFDGTEIGEEGDILDLYGIIANAKGWRWESVYHKLLMFGQETPSEHWFFAIAEGDTPEKCFYSRLALKWIDEWATQQGEGD